VTPNAAARPASPGGVALDGLLRTAFAGLRTVDPVSASGDRKAAVEKVLIQNQMEEVRALLAQGKHGEARAKVLAFAPGISTRSGLLALFGMIAVTDTERDGMARRAVDDGLKALSGGGQEQLVNAFVAGMLYLYQRDEAADVPKLYEAYCGLQPGRKPDPGARLTLALCLIKAGKQADAYTQLSGIVQDCPAAEEAPKAALLLGWVSLSQQDYEKARRDLTYVVTTYPRTPHAEKAQQLLERMPGKQ
jgi:tetratricopeptide (TPR) repeat protein